MRNYLIKVGLSACLHRNAMIVQVKSPGPYYLPLLELGFELYKVKKSSKQHEFTYLFFALDCKHFVTVDLSTTLDFPSMKGYKLELWAK